MTFWTNHSKYERPDSSVRRSQDAGLVTDTNKQPSKDDNYEANNREFGDQFGGKAADGAGADSSRNQGGKGSHTCSNARRNSTNPAIYVILPFLTLPKGPLQAGGIQKGRVLMAEVQGRVRKTVIQSDSHKFRTDIQGN